MPNTYCPNCVKPISRNLRGEFRRHKTRSGQTCFMSGRLVYEYASARAEAQKTALRTVVSNAR